MSSVAEPAGDVGPGPAEPEVAPAAAPEAAADPPAPEPQDGPPGVLFATPDNPIPDGDISGIFAGQDGAVIRYARWQPIGDSLKGTICLFGGRAEFIEKYYETIADLRGGGFHVATMDWRGQGGSARMLGNSAKGHVTTFDQYIADVSFFMREVVLPDCPGPYYVLAHSMGGNVLLQVLAQRAHWFERAVLSAPMLDLVGIPLAIPGLRRVAELACYVGLAAAFVPGGGAAPPGAGGFQDNLYTGDPARFARNMAALKAVPQLSVGAPTFGWMHAAARAMEVVMEPEFAPRIRVPVLIVGAGNDRIVSTRAIEEMARGIRGGGQITLPGARHEILQERDVIREQFWAAFNAFVPGSGA
jgi:lysophospholipase